jgi:hypothetical protein
VSSLFTSLLGGNLIANSQASGTASLLGQNAQVALNQQNTQNGILGSQESLYTNLYNQALQTANNTLGKPILNAGKLTGLKAINPTGPQGSMPTTQRYSLLGN